VESQSIARALVKNGASEQTLALIDIGKNNATLIVFSGNSVRFTYSISMAQSQLTLTIAQALKVSPEEAEKLKKKHGLSDKILQAISPFLEEFALQIQKTIDFCQNRSSHERILANGKIKKIILCGGGADLKGLPEFISEKTGILAEIGNPCLGLSICQDFAQHSDFLPFTTALGLAAGAVNFEAEKND
jgi:type IV pilus assembly protein PilM